MFWLCAFSFWYCFPMPSKSTFPSTTQDSDFTFTFLFYLKHCYKKNQNKPQTKHHPKRNPPTHIRFWTNSLFLSLFSRISGKLEEPWISLCDTCWIGFFECHSLGTVFFNLVLQLKWHDIPLPAPVGATKAEADWLGYEQFTETAMR